MSRERALRRAAREAERSRAAAERRRREERVARRRARAAWLGDRVPHRTRWRGQQGRLARRRRMENGVIAALLVLSQVLTWLLTGGWWWRLGSAVLAVLALPVLVTLVLDRRS